VLRRFGTAAEVADRVAYLLSDESAGLTGRLLEVHSGITLKLAGPDLGNMPVCECAAC
jgi:enoyl-[acyl-carrier-protein] reductase (NADH)